MPPRKLTEEEKKRAETEGNQFIQQREATASKLGLQGKRGIETAASIVSIPEQSGQSTRQRTVEEVKQSQAELTGASEIADIVKERGITQEKIDLGKRAPEGSPIKEGFLKETSQTASEIGEQIRTEPISKTIGEIAGVLKSFTAPFFGGEGKGIDQRTAEENFASAKKLIIEDIDLVKVGEKDAFEARLGFESALAENEKLLGSIHGFNKLNLRYFSQQGKDVEAMAIQNQEFINNALIELQKAEIQGALARTQAV